MKIIISVFLLSILLFTACFNGKSNSTNQQAIKANQAINKFEGEKVTKTKDEWKAQLSDMEYYVLREKGTERSFSGAYLDNKKAGVYQCKACNLPLFDAHTKFESGTGWPSFFEPINENNVGEISDYTFGMNRVEVVCNRCDGHLGHVFDDGPQPTGLRYCINSVSLKFEEQK